MKYTEESDSCNRPHWIISDGIRYRSVCLMSLRRLWGQVDFNCPGAAEERARWPLSAPCWSSPGYFGTCLAKNLTPPHLPVPLVVVETQQLDFDNIFKGHRAGQWMQRRLIRFPVFASCVFVRSQTLRKQIGLLLLSQKGKECQSFYDPFLPSSFSLCFVREYTFVMVPSHTSLFPKYTFSRWLHEHPKPWDWKEAGLFPWHRCLPWICIRLWRDCRVLRRTRRGQEKIMQS